MHLSIEITSAHLTEQNTCVLYLFLIAYTIRVLVFIIPGYILHPSSVEISELGINGGRSQLQMGGSTPNVFVNDTC